MCWIQSVSSFPDGFFLLLFYTLETVSLSAFASAELGQPFHSYPAGQIEWKQDSPQGEPRLAQSAPLKGHSGPWDRATRPLLAGVEEMENACVMLSLCVFEEMCCWFNQAFRPFFDWFRKHFLLGLLFCLFSYFCLRFFVFFFSSRYPSYLSFSPPTATSTYGKKSSSNQVTVLNFLICVGSNDNNIKTTAWCSPRLLTLKFFGVFCPCRNHQIEDPSKDWDKGDDFRRCGIPVWQILWPDARCLPGHLWLHNPEQRARKALNIDLPPALCFFSPMSEIHPSPRPPHSPPQVVPPPSGNNVTQVFLWRKLFMSSWRLVRSTSGLSTQHSQSWPSLSQQQLLCTLWAEWRTASRTVWVCVVHACLLDGSVHLSSLLWKSQLSYCLTLLLFSTFLWFFIFTCFCSFCLLFSR